MGCCKYSLRTQNELQVHVIKFEHSPNTFQMAPISCNLIKGDNDDFIEQLDRLGSTCAEQALFEKLDHNISKTSSFKEEIIIDLRPAPSPTKQRVSSKNLNNKFISML